jgi:hypothetical protein
MSLTALERVPQTAVDLSPAQLAAYARHGWVAARGFFSPAEAAQIAAWTDEVAALPETPGEHMVYYEDSRTAPGFRIVQRIENFTPYHAGFDALVNAGRLFKAVEALLGSPAVLFKDKINFKMPGGAGFEPHQDQQAGWSIYAPMFITALVSIDAATIENGCLEMTSGPRVTGMIGQEWAPLTPVQMSGLDFEPVETSPGDVLFFDSYAPHRSQANLTRAPRRILYLTYNPEADGDHCARYFHDKRLSFPPDIERTPGVEYQFRV